MILTNKAKEEFEKWYCELSKNKGAQVFDHSIIKMFWSMLPSMQYGVLIDWFDFVGIEIDITPQHSYFEYMVAISDNDFKEGRTKTKSRPQARQKAIEKANEIFNNMP